MAKKITVLVSVTNDLYTDQRVHKVCTFIQDQGYSVTLIGRKKKDSIDLPPRTYKTKRMKLLFEKGPLFYAAFNLRLFLYLISHRSSILVANDLDTLLANYAAKAFKPNTKLVYDTHEYFTEVPELTARPKVQKIWEGIESWIFPKLETIYTVNQSIADLYFNKYKKTLKVVRNISPLWKASDLKSKEELGLPTDKKIIILQGAGINIDRGAEEAVEAMSSIEGALLIIVGDGDVVPQLKSTVTEKGLTDKVRFFGKQPYATMMNFTYWADLGLSLDKDTNINYKYSLPNKIFDYIHTSTPVVCTNLIEVKNVVIDNNVGVLVEPFTVNNLASCINATLSNSKLLDELKANCVSLAQDLNWEKETSILAEIYPSIGA